MDKISIVVAVYNAEKYLKKCLDSLLNQTYQNIEIILINDASNDNSLGVCEQYSEKYENIIIINNEKNSGVSHTRNCGIDASDGRYICFVDSDDYVEPNYVERLYEYYQKYNTTPICGFVYHDEYSKCKPVIYSWSRGDGLVSLGDAFQLNKEMYLTALWNKLFDNNIIKEHNIRFDENLSMGEDLRFSVEYFKQADTEFVFVFNEALYHYTKLTNSTLMAAFARNGAESGKENLRIIKSLAIKYNKAADQEFLSSVESLRNNFVYFLMRDKKYSKKEKLSKIREIKPDFSNKDYRKNKVLVYKEKIAKLLKR